jgi:hypothetical protein
MNNTHRSTLEVKNQFDLHHYLHGQKSSTLSSALLKFQEELELKELLSHNMRIFQKKFTPCYQLQLHRTKYTLLSLCGVTLVIQIQIGHSKVNKSQS